MSQRPTRPGGVVRRNGDRKNSGSSPQPTRPQGERGTRGEDAVDLTREASRTVRRRSLTLLGNLLRPVRARLWATLAMVVVSQATRAAGPAIIAFGIDRALPAFASGDPALTWLAGGGYLAAALITALLTAGYVTSTAKLSQAMLLDLRVWVFRHTQRLSLDFHETYTSGRIISRQTSDLEALRELLDSGVSSLASGLLFMAFTAITVFALDWPSGLIMLAAAVPMTLIARWYQIRSQRAFRASRVVSARLIVHFVETMTGIRAVKAFRKERANSAAYGKLADDYAVATYRSVMLNGVFQPGLVLTGNVTVAVILLVASFRVLEGNLAVGVLLAVVLSTKRFFSPLETIAMFYNSFQSAQAALEKVSGLLEEVPTVQPPRNPVPLPAARGEVTFESVAFSYGSGPEVLPEFTLRIPAGQTVALVGATGAGKSTLAKLVARFYDPSAGAVRLDGVDLRELSTADLRRAIVMVTQEAFLFSGSVADNIALGRPDASRAEIQAAARSVGAHEFISALPDGYDTDVTKRGGRVSAGQRQLISFARAVLAAPAVLILDEATSSLDIPSERLVQTGLARLLGGTAVGSARDTAGDTHARGRADDGGGAPQGGPPPRVAGRDEQDSRPSAPADHRGVAASAPRPTDGQEARPGVQGGRPGAQSTSSDARTAIIIAHRLSTVEIADRVLVVDGGRIVEDGTPAELLAGGGRFAALHGAWRDSLV
ncbi:ABC transporter ATP-binding protein [Sinomonas sp. ASV486]|uniref:ABC transporter ATP-binding protein n=1 Tax=Sinomonas sp. ASV486 TaxID=3051170 RepID=UPI0027DC74CC|nr:ABC transporter ATP-binding protein [Sinomonas sp. ASV486]MDQ4488903.1 ABC transporter ATP-binding protein [Sinomonas sp. ASV486]